MAIDEDHSSLSFELILQPSALNNKLLSRQKKSSPKDYKKDQPDAVIVAVLSDFLQQLQSCPNLMTKVEPGFIHENSQRKKSYIQSMVLQIHAFYNWDLELVQKNLPLNLQSQLLETLLGSCGHAQNVFLTNKECITAGEALQLQEVEKSTVFAVQLFLRWVLRTLPSLNEPTPPGNKSLLYGLSFSNSGNSGGIPQDAISQLSALRFTAVKTLDSLLPTMTSLVPSANSFSINPLNLEAECKNDEGWIKLDGPALVAQTLFDLVAYNFFIENYAVCRKYLQSLLSINKDILHQYIDYDMVEGYRCALSSETSAGSVSDEQAIHMELQAWLSSSVEAAKNLGESNIEMRVKRNYPPSIETFMMPPQKFLAGKQKNSFKEKFIKSLLGAKDFQMTFEDEKPPVFFDQSVDENVGKSSKSNALMALLLERRPDHVLKLLMDFSKMINVPINKLVLRWQVDEAQKGVLLSFTNLADSGARHSQDANCVFILMSKLKQLVNLGGYNEAPSFFNTLVKFIYEKMNADKAKIMSIKINIQVLYYKMLQFNDTKLTRDEKMLPSNFVQQCRDCFNHLLSATTPGTLYDMLIMEQSIATLLNLGEFEFLWSKASDKRWKQLEVACLLSALILHFRGKQILPQTEFKKVFKTLEDILIVLVQANQVAPTKKSRDSSASGGGGLFNDGDRKILTSFISKLQHADVRDLIKAFLVSCYNSSEADSSKAIQCNLLTLPVSAKNTNLNTDVLLNMLTDMTTMPVGSIANLSNASSSRVRAEIQFARSNYLAAMRSFLETLILTTNYFSKPWNNLSNVGNVFVDWDERIFQKMIRCSTELANHHQTAILCQFTGPTGGDCDYTTAFKALEERNSNDAMEDLYNFVWDMTLLEYMVSMHAKRGEFSRKQKVLEIISQLEINTNNNEEILREARATRRAAFLRYLCSVYLRS